MDAIPCARGWLGPASVLLAACAAASQPLAEPQEGFEPIRFGDDAAHAYTRSFFQIDGREARYDAGIPTPESLIGRPVGSRLAHHAEIVAAFRSWAALAPRLRLHSYGQTYEGRELVYALISTPENLQRIDEIRAAIKRLWDPRGLSPAEGERLCATTPAIAWVGYSIHGDETSGADASLAVAHHLIACQDEPIVSLLENVVVVMDPVMNPDGRERFIAMVEQSAGYVSNLDYASMHRGRWPHGRGNHYLFDMNRDWMAGVMPETRGRWQVALAHPPQLFVDGHEMGALDTFLFYPQSDPHLPSLPATLDKWQRRFADDAGRAFDRMGWSYYTREWADAWCPFYSDAWGSLNGAIGMLYEQAGIGGAPLKRASGQVVSYRQAVHGQALASLANLETLAGNRAALLTDYLATRRGNCDGARAGGERAFVLVPGSNASRDTLLLKTLLDQGIEVWRASTPFLGRDARSVLGATEGEKSFPEGAYLVPVTQPQGALVEAYLGFDARMSDDFLQRERAELERKSSSKIYDVTAWDLGSAFGLDAWWCAPGSVEHAIVGATALASQLDERGRVEPPPSGAAAWGFVVDGGDDRSVRFAAHALELGLAVHLANEPFQVAGGSERMLPRGSLLVRRHENGPEVDALVARAAESAGVRVQAISSARAPGAGPDLGGQDFVLLARPRIALLANAPIEREGFGHLWHYLDTDLRVPVTLLDAQDLGAHDLRRYNVLLVPPCSGFAGLVEPVVADLRAWIAGGGTLIACGSSAAEIATEELGLSAVRERAAVLEDLEAWTEALQREVAARTIEIDPTELWEGGPSKPPETAATPAAKDPAASEPEPEDESEPEKEREDWLRRFSPSGVFLRAELDGESWLTYGAGAQLPVFFYGSHALVAREPVQTPARLASSKTLRLGGLLWPEARERLADSAWLTRESLGNGQVILFAAPPAFRGQVRGTLRLLANAVIYGPGMGTHPPLDW